ncbi:hypothetical protein GCM10009574_086590 [Streptomyces asiaticus]|uniref:Uncharacterized protein n=2 Tax=Streptomyces rhizosphaericus TaxID=114699 RepID=A0ABP4BFQ8_9ACTN
MPRLPRLPRLHPLHPLPRLHRDRHGAEASGNVATPVRTEEVRPINASSGWVLALDGRAVAVTYDAA